MLVIDFSEVKYFEETLKNKRKKYISYKYIVRFIFNEAKFLKE